MRLLQKSIMRHCGESAQTKTPCGLGIELPTMAAGVTGWFSLACEADAPATSEEFIAHRQLSFSGAVAPRFVEQGLDRNTTY
jgi:hypothetical protein